MALLWPAFGPDLANRSGLPKCHHSPLHVGQIIIPHVPRCGPDLGQQYVAIWGSPVREVAVTETVNFLNNKHRLYFLQTLSAKEKLPSRLIWLKNNF